ncbi:CatB-related O-acetyltransferase [Clostridium perfringens]|uniref:CatB-related O-acetyltransferase n=1 Tax=Clostridium perfringens TaxID=1502 RepID=UPI001A33B321|nr:CatB-related O-acetyltransferase [Clostridium perfringens]
MKSILIKSKLIRFFFVIYFNLKQILKNTKTRSLSYVNTKCKVGKYVKISRDCNFTMIKNIGDGTYIGNNVTINHCEYVGKFCSIAPNVSIGLGSHPINFLSTSPLFYSKDRGFVLETKYDYFTSEKPTCIGNDVWIGNSALILSGVKIGNGAIVGAGAVVTKDVPDYAIVAGVPATIVKYRFKKEILRNLSKIKWWEWDLEKIYRNKDYIEDIKLFLENNLN